VRNEDKVILFGLLGWFCFALAIGVSGSFERVSALGVAATVWGLTALALLACWKVEMLHDWVFATDLRSFIALHVTRFVGIYFLFLAGRGDLPAGFAKPAGIGDIMVAALALVILFVPAVGSSRKLLLAWNGLGLIDIVFVVFSAFRFARVDWASMASLRQIPLSLLPMFFVPLIIVSHILIFVRLRSEVAPAGTEKQ
jgi:hypothetical protein